MRDDGPGLGCTQQESEALFEPFYATHAVRKGHHHPCCSMHRFQPSWSEVEVGVGRVGCVCREFWVDAATHSNVIGHACCGPGNSRLGGSTLNLTHTALCMHISTPGHPLLLHRWSQCGGPHQGCSMTAGCSTQWRVQVRVDPRPGEQVSACSQVLCGSLQAF